VTFRTINLASHATNSGKIVMGGNVTFTPSTLGGAGTAVIQSTGALAQAGSVDLGSATRTFTITDGTPAVDVSILATVGGTGGLTKAGAGTLQLSGNNTYTGGTTVSTGLLTVSGASAKLGIGDVSVLASAGGAELQIQSGVTNAIANTATLSLFDSTSGAGGAALVGNRGYVDLGSGINETVNMLLLNGALQAPGTYGSSTSGATFKLDNFFTGTGVVTVLVPEPTAAILLMFGCAGCALRGRRRKSNVAAVRHSLAAN
jgi:autotransporter-associated beta strand protein